MDVQQHGGLDRVPGGERKPVEELARGGHLAGERLREARQLGVEGGQERPRHQLGDPAAVGGQLLPAGRGERAPEGALDEARAGLREQRPEHPRREVRREAPRVRVQVGDQLAAGHRQGAPHGVALAERRPQLGHELRLLVGLGAGLPRELGGPVLRGRVHHEHLVHEAAQAQQALHDRGDRVRHLARGEHHRDGLPLALQQQLQGELRVMVEPDQAARTMAVRVLRSHDLRLGAGAGEGARRGARSHRPRGCPRRLAHADPRRSPPGPARVAHRHRRPLVAPGRRARGGPPRPHDRHHGDGQREVARLQPAGAGHARERSRRPRALPLSHEGAGPGPGARPGAARRQVPAPGDLRRRHSQGGARRRSGGART